MNIVLANSRVRRRWAFTLTEMMLAASIFTVVIGGAVYSHVFGWRLNQWTSAKLGASDQSRIGFGRLQDEVRTAKNILIGEGTGSSFTVVADGSAQQGSALQIYPSTNTNSFIRYYMLTNTGILYRTNTSLAGTRTVAQYITNSVLFRYEDFQGNLMTSVANNNTINVNLQFYQFSYPITLIGSNRLYDYYQLQSKITRRVMD